MPQKNLLKKKKIMKNYFKNKINFILEKGTPLPKYETKYAVGLDVTAQKILKCQTKENFKKSGTIVLKPFERVLFGTGLKVELPLNIELQVRSRSGLSLNDGIIVANSPGTIDPDYQGEIGVIILNCSEFFIEIKKGQKIAQLVPNKIIRPKINKIYNFKKQHKRGEKGFGSTGK